MRRTMCLARPTSSGTRSPASRAIPGASGSCPACRSLRASGRCRGRRRASRGGSTVTRAVSGFSGRDGPLREVEAGVAAGFGCERRQRRQEARRVGRHHRAGRVQPVAAGEDADRPRRAAMVMSTLRNRVLEVGLRLGRGGEGVAVGLQFRGVDLREGRKAVDFRRRALAVRLRENRLHVGGNRDRRRPFLPARARPLLHVREGVRLPRTPSPRRRASPGRWQRVEHAASAPSPAPAFGIGVPGPRPPTAGSWMSAKNAAIE